MLVALPNMQRSQRDTARRNDYAAFSANITNYISNNNGNLPKSGASLPANKYVNSDGKDTAGLSYAITVYQAMSSNDTFSRGATTVQKSSVQLQPLDRNTATNVKIYLVTSADCTGESSTGTAMPKYNKSARAFVVYAQLETGTYCQQTN